MIHPTIHLSHHYHPQNLLLILKIPSPDRENQRGGGVTRSCYGTVVKAGGGGGKVRVFKNYEELVDRFGASNLRVRKRFSDEVSV